MPHRPELLICWQASTNLTSYQFKFLCSTAL